MSGPASFWTRTSDLFRGTPGAADAWIDAKSRRALAEPVQLMIGGGAIYGASVGAWRAWVLAPYCALKLPVLLLATVVVNALLNGIWARRLGLDLSLAQSLRAVFLSFALAALRLAGHFIYSLVVASCVGGMQWWASPLKILFGISVSGLICFPSLYILVCLSGARACVPQVVGMLLSLLALSSVFLAGFAPIAWVFSQSSTLVSLIGPVHILVWFTSIFASARVLFLGLKFWKARRTEGAVLWVMVLLVTALQMATVLHPIIGPSTQFLQTERQFFLQHWARTVSDETKND